MSLLKKIRELAVLIRIQQLGTSLTPIIGALSVKGSDLDLTNTLLLFLIAIIVNIGGQVHNDLCDLSIDKQSKELENRPLVKGTISITSAKIIILFNLFIVLSLVFFFYASFYSILLILLSFGCGTLYNLYSKRFPGADVFLSISMALFFLFGAVVVTEDFQGFQNFSMTTWILFILVFIHVFLMDALGGGLKDIENDRKSGAKTLAISLGVKANNTLFIPAMYKFIILLFEFSTVLLTISLYVLFHQDYYPIQLMLIVLLFIGMILSTGRLLSMKTFDRKKIKYVNRNHELFGYMLVPMILLNSIGIFWFIFLILLPMVWFIIFNYMLYRDSWRNPKNY